MRSCFQFTCPVRKVIREFRTECDEAETRVALGDAQPYYRDSPEASQCREHGRRLMMTFLREAIPTASGEARTMVTELIAMTMSAVGEKVSTEGKPAAEVDAYACAVADMLWAYRKSLPNPHP